MHRHTNTSSYFFILTLFSFNNVNEKNIDQYDYMEYVKILEIDIYIYIYIYIYI